MTTRRKVPESLRMWKPEVIPRWGIISGVLAGLSPNLMLPKGRSAMVAVLTVLATKLIHLVYSLSIYLDPKCISVLTPIDANFYVPFLNMFLTVIDVFLTVIGVSQRAGAGRRRSQG